ncbi:MAG: Trm112 family protein [Terracidiphilus sp.]
MPADASQPLAFDPSVINQLACPACHGALLLEEARLVCQSCGQAYLIVEGIPALIAGRDSLRG